jgi:hypothetical protein
MLPTSALFHLWALPVATGSLHSLAGTLLMENLMTLAADPYRAIILYLPGFLTSTV